MTPARAGPRLLRHGQVQGKLIDTATVGRKSSGKRTPLKVKRFARVFFFFSNSKFHPLDLGGRSVLFEPHIIGKWKSLYLLRTGVLFASALQVGARMT